MIEQEQVLNCLAQCAEQKGTIGCMASWAEKPGCYVVIGGSL